jgi:hypothetical protein
VRRAALLIAETNVSPYLWTVLRDAQEQRAARLEAERKLVEFQEQLKKVLFPTTMNDWRGQSVHYVQMTQAFQLPTIPPGNSGDAQLPPARSGTRLAASEA